MKTRNINIYWLLFVMNVPLIGEVTRRFFYYSNNIFVIGDVIALLTAVHLFCQINLFFTKNIKIHIAPAFFMGVFLFLLWGGNSFYMTHRNIMIASVGFRAVFIPFVYMYISAYYFSVHEKATDDLLLVINIWIFIMTAVALIQLFLGIEHPINVMPEGAEKHGSTLMYYSSKEVFLKFMFRPTSVTMHPGKFAQYLFTLVALKWSLMLIGQKQITFRKILLILDAIAIFVCGARSPIVFLALFLVAIFFVQRGVNLKKAFYLVRSMLIGMIIVGAIVFLKNPTLLELIMGRALSAFTDSYDRIYQNMLLPFFELVARYGFMGLGVGFFTLGSTRFGGAMFYDYPLGVMGQLENSWLRIIGEIGLPGMFFYLVMWYPIAKKALKNMKQKNDNEINAYGMFTLFWLFSMASWSITHDVLAATVTTSLGFGFSGIHWATPASLTVQKQKEFSYDHSGSALCAH